MISGVELATHKDSPTANYVHETYPRPHPGLESAPTADFRLNVELCFYFALQSSTIFTQRFGFHKEQSVRIRFVAVE